MQLDLPSKPKAKTMQLDLPSKPKAKTMQLDLPSKPKPKTMQQESERGRSKRRVVAKTAKKAKPKKEPKYKNTLLNRIREDWHQPKPTWVGGDIGLREPAYDKYPYGSLTGRGQNKKKKKK
jgi:hypothetical protein